MEWERCASRARITSTMSTQAPSTTHLPSQAYPRALQCTPFQSRVDPSFWFTLSTLKLNQWKLDASPQISHGHYRTAPKPVSSVPSQNSASQDIFMEFNAQAFDKRYVLLCYVCGHRCFLRWMLME